MLAAIIFYFCRLTGNLRFAFMGDQIMRTVRRFALISRAGIITFYEPVSVFCWPKNFSITFVGTDYIKIIISNIH